MIFFKGFLLNRVKKIFLDLKSWGPLKSFKISGSYSDLGLSIYKKVNKFSLDCPFKSDYQRYRYNTVFWTKRQSNFNIRIRTVSKAPKCTEKYDLWSFNRARSNSTLQLHM
jgi:hypothetical protein